MVKYLQLILSFVLFQIAAAQQSTINGIFTELPATSIYLKGYNGSTTYTIDSTTTDSIGRFSVRYTVVDYGLGYLCTSDNKTLYVVLSHEHTTLQATQPDNAASLQISTGKQNQLLYQYAKEYAQRAGAIQALKYLEDAYSNTSNNLHPHQAASLKMIRDEMARLNTADEQWIKQLDSNSFLAWYLPIRKLATLAVVLPQTDDRPVPATIEKFRKLNYTDPRWKKCDLYSDIFEKHFYLIQNSAGSMDTIYQKMKISIDAVLNSLQKDEKKLNDIGMFLFKLFEQRSLFKASEYLSLQLLEHKQCKLDSKLANSLEMYRNMSVGKVVPNIQISNLIHAPNYTAQNIPKSLYDINTKYKVVIFGASWCEMCMGEIPQLQNIYTKYKGKEDIEMLMVSLDGYKEGFDLLASYCPFISTCDLKQWEGKAVKDYYVSGTPTIYLLNAKNEIMVKPISIEHLDVCIEQFIINGAPLPNNKN